MTAGARCAAPSAPLRRGIQRFTGITQAMVDDAPSLEDGAARARRRLHGPDHGRPQRAVRSPGAAPGVRPHRPGLARPAGDLHRRARPDDAAAAARARPGVLADALGIEVELAHRALADAETCGRVLCALFPRLCANAATVADALRAAAPRAAAAGAGRRAAARRSASPTPATPAPRVGLRRAAHATPASTSSATTRGRVLYVGKSVSIRSRARAHFAPSQPAGGLDAARDRRRLPHHQLRARRAGAGEPADQGAQAAGQQAPDRAPTTGSSTSAAGSTSRSRSSRWRPTRRPVTRSRSARCAAAGWRSSWSSSWTRCSGCATAGGGCRAATTRRPTARWAAACRRAWATWTPTSTAGGWTRCCACSRRRPPGTGSRCLTTSTARCARAAAQQRYERAASLRRRAGRLSTILERLGGVLEATHARPRLVLAPHPSRRRPREAFWLAGGRLVDYGPVTDAGRSRERTERGAGRGPAASASSAPTSRPTRSTRCG